MNEFLKLEEIFRPNPTQTTTCSHNWLFINRGITQDLCLWVLLYFLLNNEHFNICFFLRFRFPHFSSLITSPIFLFRTKSSYQNNESSDLSSIHWTRFFFKIIQHQETWNVIGLFPSYKLEEIELILFFKCRIIQIFVHQVCVNLLKVKLVAWYKFYHTNCLM